jgi:hypothetical protein
MRTTEAEESETVVQREVGGRRQEGVPCVPSDRQSLQEDSAPCGRNRRQRSQEENQTEAIAASKRKSQPFRCEGDIMTTAEIEIVGQLMSFAPLKGGYVGFIHHRQISNNTLNSAREAHST